jgi:hypothetical protein
MKRVGLLKRFLMRVGLAQHQPDGVRLGTDIDSLQAWVDRHKPPAGTAGGPPPPLSPWFENCQNYLLKARQAVDANAIASGYEYLHIAERESVFGMTQTERKVWAQSLIAEAAAAEKFGSSWRVQAIKRLLDQDQTDSSPNQPQNECGTDVLAEALAEAIAHRNTLDRNGHRKTDRTRWQLAWLGSIVGVLVLAAFLFVLAGRLPPDLENVNLLPYCIYLGLRALSVRRYRREELTARVGFQK